MPLVGLAVRIDLECRSCKAAVAMHGLGERARCPGCDTEIALAPEFLEDVLSDELDYRGELEPPLFRVMAGQGVVGRYRTAYGLGMPCCPCGRELPLDSLAGVPPGERSADDMTIMCPGCGAGTKVRRRFPAERMGHELARGLLLEHRPAPRLPNGGDVIVWCPRDDCGDAMGLTEYKQFVDCESCGCPFEVTQSRWDRLVALPGARAFYLVLEEPDEPGAVAPPPSDLRSVPLALGWVAFESLLLPLLVAICVIAVLFEVGEDQASSRELLAPVITAVAIIAGVMTLIRLPLLLSTLLGDRAIVIDDNTLHVPVVGMFQLRRWRIPIRDLVAVSLPRRSGGSTKVALALRDGQTRRFSAAVVKDRYALVHSLERRIAAVTVGNLHA